MPKLTSPNKVLSLVTGQAVPGNAGVALMARIRGNSFSLITQAAVTGITYSVYDIQALLNDPDDSTLTATQVVSSTSMTVSSVIYDSLQQTDGLWTKDGPGNLGSDGSWGYNFKFVVPASSFTVARSGNKHQVDVVFDPVTGENFRIPFQVATVKVYL